MPQRLPPRPPESVTVLTAEAIVLSIIVSELYFVKLLHTF